MSIEETLWWGFIANLGYSVNTRQQYYFKKIVFEGIYYNLLETVTEVLLCLLFCSLLFILLNTIVFTPRKTS